MQARRRKKNFKAKARAFFSVSVCPCLRRASAQLLLHHPRDGQPEDDLPLGQALHRSGRGAGVRLQPRRRRQQGKVHVRRRKVSRQAARGVSDDAYYKSRKGVWETSDACMLSIRYAYIHVWFAVLQLQGLSVTERARARARRPLTSCWRTRPRSKSRRRAVLVRRRRCAPRAAQSSARQAEGGTKKASNIRHTCVKYAHARGLFFPPSLSCMVFSCCVPRSC